MEAINRFNLPSNTTTPHDTTSSSGKRAQFKWAHKNYELWPIHQNQRVPGTPPSIPHAVIAQTSLRVTSCASSDKSQWPVSGLGLGGAKHDGSSFDSAAHIAEQQQFSSSSEAHSCNDIAVQVITSFTCGMRQNVCRKRGTPSSAPTSSSTNKYVQSFMPQLNAPLLSLERSGCVEEGLHPPPKSELPSVFRHQVAHSSLPPSSHQLAS